MGWRGVSQNPGVLVVLVGSDNGLSPDWRQAIIWTNAGILLIGPLGTNFREILIEIVKLSFKENAFENVVCETAAILPRPQCVNWQNKMANVVTQKWCMLIPRIFPSIHLRVSQCFYSGNGKTMSRRKPFPALTGTKISTILWYHLAIIS